MGKKSVFYEIFDIVVSETEVEKSLIMSSTAKTREVVDARYLLFISFIVMLALMFRSYQRCCQ